MTYPLVYVLFIGGAADKTPFLWDNIQFPFTKAWVHHTIGKIAHSFHQELALNVNDITAQKKDPLIYKIDYVSYTDVFFEQLREVNFIQDTFIEPTDARYLRIKKNIGSNTKVYIVGHSLGGWNGAHLTTILSRFNIDVDYLITLDPVGTGNHEVALINPLIKKAQIYTHNPVPVANYWFNIQASHINISKKQLTNSFEDWVAWAGGQWLITQNYPTVKLQICEKTNFSHKHAVEMFNYHTKLHKSPHEALLNAIVTNIRTSLTNKDTL